MVDQIAMKESLSLGDTREEHEEIEAPPAG